MSTGAARRAKKSADGAVDRLADLLRIGPEQLPDVRAEVASLISQRIGEVLRNSQLDELTGALRRGAGARALARELARARRRDSKLAVGLIDLDHLKEVNDRHGHAVGDVALEALVAAFAERLRPYDFIARWGGDEFLCVLPGCNRSTAEHIAASIGVEFGHRTGCTFTSAFAEADSQADIDEIIDEADRGLYQKKREREPAAPWLAARTVRLVTRRRTMRARHQGPAVGKKTRQVLNRSPGSA